MTHWSNRVYPQHNFSSGRCSACKSKNEFFFIFSPFSSLPSCHLRNGGYNLRELPTQQSPMFSYGWRISTLQPQSLGAQLLFFFLPLFFSLPHCVWTIWLLVFCSHWMKIVSNMHLSKQHSVEKLEMHWMDILFCLEMREISCMRHKNVIKQWVWRPLYES